MSKQRKIRAMAEAVAEKLIATRRTLATAESCTGGWVSQSGKDPPRSPAWVSGGIVTYSHQAEMSLLGV